MEKRNINNIKLSVLETQLMTIISKGYNTFEAINDELEKEYIVAERSVIETLQSLQSKNMIEFDTKTKKYSNAGGFGPNDYVILEGNMLLPVTVIEIPEEGIKYITRGNWYKVPIDFDIRKIIWNIALDTKNKSTLTELIRTSVMKERKSKIRHNAEYDMLKNKIIPYSDKIKLYINAVGEEVTDVTIMFQIKFGTANNVFTGFTVHTEISTKEMLDELSKPKEQRDYVTNIKLNRIYNISDFILSKNEIPVMVQDDKLTYCKITGVKKNFELTYFEMDSFGTTKKVDIEEYDSIGDLIEVLKKYFEGFTGVVLDENEMYVDFGQ